MFELTQNCSEFCNCKTNLLFAFKSGTLQRIIILEYSRYSMTLAVISYNQLQGRCATSMYESYKEYNSSKSMIP